MWPAHLPLRRLLLLAHAFVLVDVALVVVPPEVFPRDGRRHGHAVHGRRDPVRAPVARPELAPVAAAPQVQTPVTGDGARVVLAAVHRREPDAAEGLDAGERVPLLNVAVAQLAVRVTSRGHHGPARGEHGGVVTTRGGSDHLALVAARARNLDPHAVLGRAPVILGVGPGAWVFQLAFLGSGALEVRLVLRGIVFFSDVVKQLGSAG